MIWRIAAVLFFIVTPALAEDRRTQAIPALVEQRNGALDAAALCAGDLSALQKENASLKAEIDKLKKPEDRPSEAKP